jgi:hypothetical protein
MAEMNNLGSLIIEEDNALKKGDINNMKILCRYHSKTKVFWQDGVKESKNRV